MPHPNLANRTAFFADALYLVDEQFHLLLTLVIKGSFAIVGRSLAVCTEQRPLYTEGKRQQPDVETSSYRYEPEVTPYKLATDVVFVGHAHAPNTRTRQMDVGLRVGPLVRSLRVFGDRMWIRALGARVMTPPQTFTCMPICYERAFGGGYTSDSDPQCHACEPRNPVGRGFHKRWGRRREELYAPNLEDIEHLIRSPYDTPTPAGFGFISPHWQPRLRLAGTYDAAWRKYRFPLLPVDFDRRYYNAASPGLIAPGYLRGDEDVQTVGLSPEGRLGFRLPGIPPPALRVSLANHRDHRPQTRLDTIIIDLDDHILTMIWRASMPLPSGPHDVRAIEVICPDSLRLPRSETLTSPTQAANHPTQDTRPWP